MCKLLMIDDNQLEHQIMQIMLNRYQLFPDTTHSLQAKPAIEQMEENYLNNDLLPDVIFLDLNMPGFSGWDFMLRFSKLYEQIKKTIDVYIVSSSIYDPDKAKAMDYPFVKSYLSKPLKKEALISLYSNYQV